MLPRTMKAVQITTGPLERRRADDYDPDFCAPSGATWINCDYPRTPGASRVGQMYGWVPGEHMGNSEQYLHFVLARNWPEAKAAARAAVVAAGRGDRYLHMACGHGLYRSPACASIAAIALHRHGYAVHVRHVALEARAPVWGAVRVRPHRPHP